MSTISNRFYVTALEDGTTLHGNLSHTGKISQSYNGASCVPDWNVAENQPTIYVTLLNGSSPVGSTSITNVNWLYNGTIITFNPTTNISTNTGVQGKFLKTTYTYIYAGEEITTPALKIIGNLASSTNADLDVISFNAEYSSSGASIPFGASIQIRITSVSGSTYFGILDFVDGKSNITASDDEVEVYASLYSGTSQVSSNNFTVRWYVNGEEKESIDSVTIGGVEYPSLKLTANDVVDYATIKCEFVVSNEVVAVDFAGVDDMQDPEFLYIQYNGSNGNAASLKYGEQVIFSIFVGKRDDATPSTLYNSYKVQLLDGGGNVVTGNLDSIPDADENGWRQLSVSSNKASLTVKYNVVNGSPFNKNLTGIVLANIQE